MELCSQGYIHFHVLLTSNLQNQKAHPLIMSNNHAKFDEDAYI